MSSYPRSRVASFSTGFVFVVTASGKFPDVFPKGLDPLCDSYSAFREADRTTHTGLAGYLGERAAHGALS